MYDELMINWRKRALSGTFHGFSFKEGNQVILYIPSMNLSAYGSTLREARSMMDVVIDDFTESLLDLGEFRASKVLSEYGFKKNRFFKKKYQAEGVSQEEVFKQYDIPRNTPVKKVPVYA